jgi:hypothetical protein
MPRPLRRANYRTHQLIQSPMRPAFTRSNKDNDHYELHY